ncbi:hypothetical protein N7512_008970 [Penicillium capsulatum]|nr:hypothetical protein N7512_008970 [Penicillium capsulatum]
MDLFWTKGECDQPEWWAMVPITLPLSNALEGKQVAKENLILRTLDVFKGLAYMKGSKLAHFSVSLETVVGKPEAKSWLGNKLKLPKVQLDGFHWTSDVKSYTFNDEQKPNIEHYRSPEMRSLGEGDSSANDVYAATILALHILVGWEQRDNVRRLSDKINANAASMYNRDPPEDPPSAKDTLVGALHTHKWGLSDKMIDLLGRGLAYAPHQGLGGDGRAEIEDLIAEWEKTPEYEKAAKK